MKVKKARKILFRFLKDEGIYAQFMTNSSKDDSYGFHDIGHIYDVEGGKFGSKGTPTTPYCSASSLFAHAFDWEASPEGFKFWEDYYGKFLKWISSNGIH